MYLYNVYGGTHTIYVYNVYGGTHTMYFITPRGNALKLMLLANSMESMDIASVTVMGR
jgi:hypothetical protein